MSHRRLDRSDRKSPRTQAARRRATRIAIDALEPRMLMSTYTVTNPADNGNNAAPLNNSLRWAVIQANQNPGSTINFDFKQVQPPSPLITIFLKSQLPAISADHTRLIGPPVMFQEVAIDGSATASGAAGLRLLGSNDWINQLDIVNFPGAGIVDQGNTNLISDCFVGTHSTGVGGFGNGEGIDVFAAAGAHLLDDEVKDNLNYGIRVVNSGGVLINGGESEANQLDGLLINGMGPTAGFRYTTQVFDITFDENLRAGVRILNSSYNQIGMNGHTTILGDDGELNAQLDVEPFEGNIGDGALIESTPGQVSTNNVIRYCYIAGNAGNGVELYGAGTTRNSLIDNEIGVTQTTNDNEGSLLIAGNMQDGIRIDGGANSNTIGGPGLIAQGQLSDGGGNLIINSGGAGVYITDPGSNQNIVQSNIIGPALNLMNWGGAQANAGGGLVITDSASNNLIGGLAPVATQSGLGNVISANDLFGVAINGAGTSHNVLAGNWIGTDDTGQNADPNDGPGVLIEAGATSNLIGLYAPFVGRFGNVISGNDGPGVQIRDAGTMDNSLHGNDIGTGARGTTALPNVGVGVLVSNGASVNFIGGVSTALITGVCDNLISANAGDGVQLTDPGTAFNLVAGNFIGSDVNGNLPLPNTGIGIDMADGAANNIVGGGLAALGNVVAANTGPGVVVDAASAFELIQFNRIGTSWDGTQPDGNVGSGVVLLGSAVRVANNQISANHQNGVEIDGSFDWLYGNNIGASAPGSTPLGNTFSGVLVNVTQGSGSNTIGGPLAGLGNQISGNGGDGIAVTGTATSNNTIDGNMIGTDATGTAIVPNQLSGIVIDDTSGYVIGGSTPAARNVISGNTQDGILLTDGTTGISVIGNMIGCDAHAQTALGNGINGVEILGASNNTIGGATPALGNFISGNVNDGVLIRAIPESPSGPIPATGNTVIGNSIGTDLVGQSRIANDNNGVELELASTNYIGGSAAGDGNLISGNGADGVAIGAHSTGNYVQGNRIGTIQNGNQPLANGHNGVRVVDSSGNLIGGIGVGAGNLISGNTEDGVVLISLADDNSVQSNRIGTNADGTVALPNGGNGVSIGVDSNNNLIGGVSRQGISGGNVISGNTLAGVWITSGSSNNKVQRNFIGTDVHGLMPLGNSQSGVSITDGATGNVIGGNPVTGINGALAVGNVISGNALDGVTISDLTTNNNLVQGNQIGTYISNLTYRGNGRNGVFILGGAQFNTVGGSIDDANTIAYNTAAGVAIGASVNDPFTIGNQVTYNSIFSNGTIGIDLGSDGPTLNTPPSPHTGPNALQSTPVLKLLSATATSTTVRIFLNTTPGATINIQLFASPGPNASGNVEGQTFLLDVPVQIDGGGNIAGQGYIDVTISQNLLGQYLTATATDTTLLNTSEFSQAVHVQ